MKKSVALNSVGLDHDGCCPEWVELIPSGLVVGRDGRRWKNEAPEKIVQHFAELGRDLPIDVEHASEHKAPNGEPAPAVGWVSGIESRDGAIWGRITWNNKGRTLVSEKEYRYLSPVILYRPEDKMILGLTSVGLTNQPNLRLPALNQEQGISPEEKTMFKALLAALGLPENASEAEAVARVGVLKNDVARAMNRAENPDLEKFVPRADYDAVLAKAENARKQLHDFEERQLARTIDELIGQALEEGKITPATKDYHVAQCRQEGGLERFRDYCKTAPVIAGDSGLDGKQPEQQKTALNTEESQVCTMLGLDAEQFQKTAV